MGRNLVETLMGAVVLAVAGYFMVFAYTSTNVRAVRGYEVIAKFERVDGVATGTDVKISGIKVGTLVDQRLDPETFLAVLRISLDNSVKLPEDTVAQISSEGLLGSNFVALVPGGADKIIPPGGEIKYTQAPVNLVQMLGKLIFNAADNQTPKDGAAPK